MIQLMLQHLNQVFGQAVLDLKSVQTVHPTVEVSNPKNYLMILDQGGVKVVKADPSPDLLVVLVPALKFDDASGQVGVDESVETCCEGPFMSLALHPQEIFLFEPSDN